jgi:hypothetical protein
MSMHPEPTTVPFESRDGLLSHVQEVVNRSGYVVSIKRSTADKKDALTHELGYPRVLRVRDLP